LEEKFMRIAVLKGVKNFVIEEASIPSLEVDEVLMRVKACGICTSELYLWNGKIKDAAFPLYLGHEPSGVVEDAGRKVNGLNIGDHVTFLSETGCFAEYAKAKKGNIVKIADNIPFEEALGEPVACAVNGIRRSNIQFGDNVVVIGCGFMGLLLIQLASLRGPSRILAVDINDERLKLAADLGADLTVNPREIDAIKYVKGVTNGRGADVVIEATGEQAPLSMATEMVRIRGRLVIFGYHVGEPRLINMQMWNWKGLDVINAHEREPEVYMEGMQIGMMLLSKGKIKLKNLITHKYPLEEINNAFNDVNMKIGGLIKAVVAP
jgi:2-desacetyl-2-hydroxyethyl bacteriochlorophyllide A dehydrogenase